MCACLLCVCEYVQLHVRNSVCKLMVVYTKHATCPLQRKAALIKYQDKLEVINAKVRFLAAISVGGGDKRYTVQKHSTPMHVSFIPPPPRLFFLFLCVIVCFVVVCRKRMSSQSLRQRQSWKQSSNCTGSVFPPNSCQSCCACARVRCACVCVVHPWDCEFTLSRCSLLHVHRIHAYQSWRVQTFSTAFW